MADLSAEDVDTLRKELHRYGDLLSEMGEVRKHPFAGTQELNLQPTDLERLKRDAGLLEQKVSDLRQKITQATDVVGIEQSPTLALADKLLQLSAHLSQAPTNAALLIDGISAAPSIDNLEYAAQKAVVFSSSWKDAQEKYVDAALAHEIALVRSGISAGTSFWSRLGGKYRNSSKELSTLLKTSLPKAQNERLALVDELADLQKKQSNFSEQSTLLREVLRDSWRGEESDFQWLSNVIGWYKRLKSIDAPITNASLKAILTGSADPNSWAPPQKSELDSFKSELKNILSKLKLNVEYRFGAKALEVYLEQYQQFLKSIAEQSGQYDQWRDYYRLHTLFAKHSLRSLLKRIEKSELSPAEAETELRYARAEAQWRICTSKLPKLAELQDISRHDLVQAFRELESNRIVEIREAVRLKHLSKFREARLERCNIYEVNLLVSEDTNLSAS